MQPQGVVRIRTETINILGHLGKRGNLKINAYKLYAYFEK